MAARYRNLGIMLAGVWFLLHGLFGLVAIAFPGGGVLMSVLALFTGILLLAGR